MNADLQPIATAVQRVQSVLKRRPEKGPHDDASATARWQGGVRVVTSGVDGALVISDMPVELGGTGGQATPGWLFRAGFASCAATCIVLQAAAEGVALAALDVSVGSRSDTRGLLGIPDEAGRPVSAGPAELQVQVRIDAPGVAAERLRALVDEAMRCSPVPTAVRQATPMVLQLDIASA
jgi:uncharacterized OsmC-like protein